MQAQKQQQMHPIIWPTPQVQKAHTHMKKQFVQSDPTPGSNVSSGLFKASCRQHTIKLAQIRTPACHISTGYCGTRNRGGRARWSSEECVRWGGGAQHDECLNIEWQKIILDCARKLLHLTVEVLAPTIHVQACSRRNKRLSGSGAVFARQGIRW